jgi:hypothetical protein
VVSLVGMGVKRTYVNGADEILISHENIGHADTEENRQYPCSHKSFHCLFG